MVLFYFLINYCFLRLRQAQPPVLRSHFSSEPELVEGTDYFPFISEPEPVFSEPELVEGNAYPSYVSVAELVEGNASPSYVSVAELVEATSPEKAPY